DERVRLGERQQPPRFLEGLPHLHGHARVEPATPHLAFGVCRQEVAPQPGHRLVDPAVLDRVVSPEMLMSVDTRHGPRPVLGPWSSVLGPFLVHGPFLVLGPWSRTRDQGRRTDEG